MLFGLSDLITPPAVGFISFIWIYLGIFIIFIIIFFFFWVESLLFIGNVTVA